MILAQSCGITSVSTILSALLQRKPNTVRQQLREWCYAAADKAGQQRSELAVAHCFAPLFGWIVSQWVPVQKRLALAMDASTLGQRFSVLAISVVSRGCAIPVAWKVVHATEPGQWRPHWEALFQALDHVVPADWLVIVLADRGLYAQWLFQRIQQSGWHPFLRINHQGNFAPQGQPYRPLSSLVPDVGMGWVGTGHCFSGAKLPCTLVARWDAGHEDPWLIVTDLKPDHANATWYGMRCWIACLFRRTKRGGWHWEQTKMIDPERAERLWLAMAVATLWCVSLGGQTDATLPAASFDALPPLHPARRAGPRRTQPRRLGVFRTELPLILADLLTNRFRRGRLWAAGDLHGIPPVGWYDDLMSALGRPPLGRSCPALTEIVAAAQTQPALCLLDLARLPVNFGHASSGNTLTAPSVKS